MIEIKNDTTKNLFDDMEKKFGPFWEGPFKIRVPWRISNIPYNDQVNEIGWYYDSDDKTWFTM